MFQTILRQILQLILVGQDIIMMTVYLGSFLAINCGEQLLADLLYFEFLQVFIVILRPSTFNTQILQQYITIH